MGLGAALKLLLLPIDMISDALTRQVSRFVRRSSVDVLLTDCCGFQETVALFNTLVSLFMIETIRNVNSTSQFPSFRVLQAKFSEAIAASRYSKSCNCLVCVCVMLLAQ
jgi:hypothetical protein